MLRLLLPTGVVASAVHPATLGAQPDTSTANIEGTDINVAATNTLEPNAVAPVLYIIWETVDADEDITTLNKLSPWSETTNGVQCSSTRIANITSPIQHGHFSQDEAFFIIAFIFNLNIFNF